ncbi:SchA/CurD-like domain-containing protein [Goodfellowiella coeruleoviolacea]|uniref:SchA/CurD like domain-containing protein n=1 Tax=Goodfellowiella coeruleoviolacea TaxID=334858 RepID=A0AAE3GGX6_9PSEU|nr:SchA/CurD-like domain-containing protein [Goodfellowiella coeruleoviolacea]MCP2167493.1 SchA/CurD like domain-containing protein [Goodfellowiella coeruleoviolacea]
MSTWHALFYPLKPGNEDTVKELFRASGRPRFEVTDGEGNVVGHLLGTMAFVGKGMAVRVIEVEGSLPQVAAHMSRQVEVREFERQLEPYLAKPRDMNTPEGAREFFREAAMECVLVRRHDQPLAAQPAL